jgi:hypothetical protein
MKNWIGLGEHGVIVGSKFMEVGQFGILREGPYKDHIIVKQYGGDLISLTDTKLSWPSGTSFTKIELIPKGTSITIVVGGDEEDCE